MWFKVDDDFPHHPKFLRALKHARDKGGSPAAVAALWHVAGEMCAKQNTEGVVGDLLVEEALRRLHLKVDDGSPSHLVAAGLWHDRRTVSRCERCAAAVPKLDRGSYLFHDWVDYQFTKEEVATTASMRRKQRNKALNRDRKLVQQILARDGTLCRYCGIRVNFNDRRGVYGGTYDHVDPDGENSLTNVVVACRGCNAEKSHRTPEEAGMPLLEPGTIWTPGEPRPEPARSELNPGASDPASRARRVGEGPGLDGSGQRPGRSGAGLDGTAVDGPGPGSEAHSTHEHDDLEGGHAA